MKIQPENTAITTGVSKSATKLEEQANLSDSILDYGAGKLRNSKYLKEKGFQVSVLDTDFQFQRAKEQDLSLFENVFVLETYQAKPDYEHILCSFVLNVIPDEKERIRAIENIHESLKDNGKLFLEVRGKQGISQNKYKEPYNDGFVIGKHEVKTFQKPFTKEQVQELLLDKFDIEHLQSLSDSILAIAKKK